MKKKKGYVLVTTIIIFAFIITVLTAVLTLAVANVNNVNNYNKMNSSFYAAESGTERLKYVTENGTKNIIRDTFGSAIGASKFTTFDKTTLAGFDTSLENAVSAAMSGYQKSGVYYDNIKYSSGLSSDYTVTLDCSKAVLIAPTPKPASTSITYTYEIPVVSTGKYGRKSKVENSFLELTIKVIDNSGLKSATLVKYAWKG